MKHVKGSNIRREQWEVQTHEERINKDRGFEKGIVQGIDK